MNDRLTTKPPNARPKLGRPPTYGVRMRKRLIGLDEASWKKARKLGNGNVSEGVRKALARA